jgi:hypothetical protein
MKNIYCLLGKQLFEDRKGLLVYTLSAFAALFLFGLLRAFSQSSSAFQDTSYYMSWYGKLLFIGGFIITSITFAQSMHSKSRQHAWFMLPVHAYEKLAAKIIYLGILYPIALILFFTLSSLVVEGTAALIFGRTVAFFHPYSLEVWKTTANYLVLQSIFLLGAAYFTSAHFIKTVLTIILVSMSFGLFAMLLFRVVYTPYFPAAFTNPYFMDQAALVISNDTVPLVTLLERISTFAYWILAAPFCWTVTYFRIREKEATDAV